MTTHKPRTSIDIPTDWTSQQAKIVWEFLVEEIGTSIWNVYGDRIDQAIKREETLLERASRGELPDDDYPF